MPHPINVLFRGEIFPVIFHEADEVGSILKQIGFIDQGQAATIVGVEAPGLAPENKEFGHIPPPGKAHYSDTTPKFRIKNLRIMPEGPGPGFSPSDPPSIEIEEV